MDMAIADFVLVVEHSILPKSSSGRTETMSNATGDDPDFILACVWKHFLIP
jgi:hypothetical protein